MPVGLAIGLRDPGPLAHPAQQARVVVALLVPASPGHDLRQRLPPMPCLRILHRREAALQDQLEVLDPGLEAPREPLEQRISMRHPADPIRLDPLFQRVRRAGQGVDVAVGTAPLGRRRIEVEDDLGVRVDRLQLPNEAERRVDVVFRILRVADHERELGNDAVGPGLLRDRHGLRDGEPLPHPLQSLIRTGLGAEEDDF